MEVVIIGMYPKHFTKLQLSEFPTLVLGCVGPGPFHGGR